MNQFVAYFIVVLSSILGGGSLLLFGAFLISGPYRIIQIDMSEAHALIWDGFISLVFFLQHSGMIRTSFRSWFSSFIPRHYHAAVYSIMSGIVLTAVVLLWQPSQIKFFQIQGPAQLLPLVFSLLAIGGFVWGVRSLRTFDPFGRISIMLPLRGKQAGPQEFALRGPYRWVRHPLYFFVLVLIWSVSELRADRFLFNVLWTSWIVLGS